MSTESYGGPERRNRPRQQSLSQRRLAYWRQLEDLGRRLLEGAGDRLTEDMVALHRQLSKSMAQHQEYLEALRQTIEAEERGFKELENTFLSRLENEHKRREQMLARVARDRPDAETLAKSLRLAKEELAVVKRKIVEEETRTAGEITPLLKDLRLDAIRRDRAIRRDEDRYTVAKQVTSPQLDARVVQIDERLSTIQAEMAEAETSIDQRLVVHQENLRTYSDSLAELRKEARNHLIKVGDACLVAGIGQDDEDLKAIFDRLIRLIREGAA